MLNCLVLLLPSKKYELPWTSIEATKIFLHLKEAEYDIFRAIVFFNFFSLVLSSLLFFTIILSKDINNGKKIQCVCANDKCPIAWFCKMKPKKEKSWRNNKLKWKSENTEKLNYIFCWLNYYYYYYKYYWNPKNSWSFLLVLLLINPLMQLNKHTQHTYHFILLLPFDFYLYFEST